MLLVVVLVTSQTVGAARIASVLLRVADVLAIISKCQNPSGSVVIGERSVTCPFPNCTAGRGGFRPLMGKADKIRAHVNGHLEVAHFEISLDLSRSRFCPCGDLVAVTLQLLPRSLL